MLEKKIDFINEDIGLSSPHLVRGDSIEDTLLQLIFKFQLVYFPYFYDDKVQKKMHQSGA